MKIKGMCVKYIWLILMWLVSSSVAQTSSANPPSAREFLQLFQHDLQQAQKAITQGSITRNFVRFRGYTLIAYPVYKTMDKQELQQIQKPLIFIHGMLVSKPLYSELGGVSIGANIEGDIIYLSFQGRYMSDLLALEGGGFYALCALWRVNRCLLLGIGEKWW